MKKRLKNNFGLKILAFLFAFLLWILVVNIDDPIKTKTFENIAVVVEHEEYITTKDQKTYQILDNTQIVDVTVSARRSQLKKISEEDIVATADMRELYLDSLVPIDVTVKDHSFESAEANPRNMRVQIENNASVTFPITAVTTGNLRDGYVIGSVTADPERVTINGPESVVERISKVVAEVDVSGMSQDACLESVLTLYDAENEAIDQSLLGNNLGKIGVSVNVELYRAKSVSVKVDTSLLTAAEGYSLAEITYSPKEIRIAATKEILASIEEISIPAEALEGDAISQKTERIIDITEYLPENVKLVDETGGSILVTISVEKDGTKNFNLPVGSISVKNLNSNLTMTYDVTDDVEIHVRGPKSVLNAYSIDGAATINLSEYKEEGTFTVPVEIELPKDCALESEVKVKITLTEK